MFVPRVFYSERMAEMEDRIEHVEFSLDDLRRAMATGFRHVEESQLRTETEMREFKTEMREFKIEMQNFKSESNKRWGDLANKMGTMVEDLVHPSLPRIVWERTGMRPEFFAINVRKRNPEGVEREFDAFAVAGDSIYLNSTKSKLRPQYGDDFVAEIAEFRRCFPEYAEKKVIGVLATLSASENTIEKAERNGFLLLAVGGDLMELVNSPGFKPQEW